MYDWRGEYEAVVRQLPEIVTVAMKGDTGRPEDDLFAKVALVGFGRYAPQMEWGWDHLLEVRRWRAGDYSDEALMSYGSAEARRYALLACAWLGTVLGLSHTGSISETEALTAYALLPGFVAREGFEVLKLELG